MKTIFVLILIFFSQIGFAQTDENEDINEKSSVKQEFRDKFYLGVVSSYYVDFVTTPLYFENRRVGAIPDPNDPSKYIDQYGSIPFQTTYNSFFSVGIEPRYNIKDFSSNLSIAITAPLTIGFGQAYASSENVESAFGYGNFQLPILAKVYLGSGSTYASKEDFGVSAGFGFEVNKIGIIAPGASEAEQNGLRPWVMPSASLGIHFWRGSSPMEVNAKYGFGPLDEYRIDKFGQFLNEGPRTTRASTLKLTFVYLLNY